MLELDTTPEGTARYVALENWNSQLLKLQKEIVNKIHFDRVPKKAIEFYGFIRYGCSITPFSFIQTRNITGFFDKRLHLFLTPFLKDFNRFLFRVYIINFFVCGDDIL